TTSHGPIAAKAAVKAGRRSKQLRASQSLQQARSQNIRPFHLIRARECAREKTSSQKRRMRDDVPQLPVRRSRTGGPVVRKIQVLIDGIPINHGLQGAFNFADLTIDDVDHIEVVRGPQSTLYGPRALAGAIQIFTRRGSGETGAGWGFEGGSFNSTREFLESSGQLRDFDYSLGASR